MEWILQMTPTWFNHDDLSYPSIHPSIYLSCDMNFTMTYAIL
jgi:hypothetical protein